MKIRWIQTDEDPWHFYIGDCYCGWIFLSAEGYIFNHRNPEDMSGKWLYPYGRPGHLTKTLREAMDRVEQFYRENPLHQVVSTTSSS